jgi:hypothetical protein
VTRAWLAFAATDLVLAILLVEALRRARRATPCPPARDSFVEAWPDESDPDTEALLLDRGRAMDGPELNQPSG